MSSFPPPQNSKVYAQATEYCLCRSLLLEYKSFCRWYTKYSSKYTTLYTKYSAFKFVESCDEEIAVAVGYLLVLRDSFNLVGVLSSIIMGGGDLVRIFVNCGLNSSSDHSTFFLLLWCGINWPSLIVWWVAPNYCTNSDQSPFQLLSQLMPVHILIWVTQHLRLGNRQIVQLGDTQFGDLNTVLLRHLVHPLQPKREHCHCWNVCQAQSSNIIQSYHSICSA